MADIATLGIRIDSAPAAKAATDLNRLRDAAKGVTVANDNVAKSGVRMAGAMRTMSVAAGAAAVAVTALAGVAIKKFITNSMEAEKQQAGLAAALRSTAGASGQTIESLNAHADALQRMTTYDDEAIGRAQELLLTFTKIGGATFPRATEAVLDLSARMGGDLAGAAVQLGKALNDPIIGITALNRQGLTFSETQKETIKGLVESGQLMKAQGLILDELAIQTGGAAAALRDTLGGAVTGLKNNWNDAFEVANKDTSKLKDAVNGLADAVGSDSFKNFVQTIGSGLVGALASAVKMAGALGDALNNIGNSANQRQLRMVEARLDVLGDQYRRNPNAILLGQMKALEAQAVRLRPVTSRAGAAAMASIATAASPIATGGGFAVSRASDGSSARRGRSAAGGISIDEIPFEEIQLSVKEVLGVIEPLNLEITKMPELIDSAAEAARDFSRSAVSSFVQDLRQGVSVTDALTASLGRLIEKMADMALQEYVSGMFGGASGGPLGGLFKAFMPGRAGGGMVNAGQPYQVGEFGRETFIPNVSGRIVPNMQGSGGQQRVHVTVGVATDGNGNLMPFVQSVSQQQAVNVVQRAAPQIVNQAVGAVGKNFGQLQSRYQGRVA